MNNARAQAKAKMGELVRRVMADGKLDAGEREEMAGVYRQAVLTVADIREVFMSYLGEVRDEVLADGVVTDEERARCRAVVAALKIPPALIPADFQALVAGG
jgi:hypothetical protein